MTTTKTNALERGRMQHILVTALREAPWNARSDYGPMAELEASIREGGILNPLIARPLVGRKDSYEVFCGHRRLRAAVAVGLESVPVIVRPCGDQEARSLAIVDNLQREGLGPLDEARAFDELKKLGLTAADIAARCVPERAAGVAYVHTRLALLDLPEKGQDLVRSGQMPLPVAAAILRLEAELRPTAVARVQEAIDKDPTHLSLVDLVERLMLPLAEAQFDTDDATLNPARGSCSGCTYRTGNQAALFGAFEGKDHCTDAACYRLKLDETFRRRAADHQDRGFKVASKKEAAALFPWKAAADNISGSAYVAVYGEGLWTRSRQVSVKAVLREAGAAAPATMLVQNPHNGRIVELVPRKEVEALALGQERSKARAGDDSQLTKAEIKAKLERQRVAFEARVAQETVREVAAQVAEAAEKQWSAALHVTPTITAGPVGAQLHALARLAMERWGIEAMNDAALRRGWIEKRHNGLDAMHEAVARMSAAEALGLAAEVVVWWYKGWLLNSWLKREAGDSDVSSIFDLVDGLGVDPLAIRAAVEKDVRAKHQAAIDKQALKAAAKGMKTGGRPKAKRKGRAT